MSSVLIGLVGPDLGWRAAQAAGLKARQKSGKTLLLVRKASVVWRWVNLNMKFLALIEGQEKNLKCIKRLKSGAVIILIGILEYNLTLAEPGLKAKFLPHIFLLNYSIPLSLCTRFQKYRVSLDFISISKYRVCELQNSISVQTRDSFYVN